MELTLALAIGLLAACGVKLLLGARSFQLIIGLTLLGFAVNLFLFVTGGLRVGQAPLLSPGESGTPERFADPLPQALVLTAIVIGFAAIALLLVVAITARGLMRSDHVDGREV